MVSRYPPRPFFRPYPSHMSMVILGRRHQFIRIKSGGLAESPVIFHHRFLLVPRGRNLSSWKKIRFWLTPPKRVEKRVVYPIPGIPAGEGQVRDPMVFLYRHILDPLHGIAPPNGNRFSSHFAAHIQNNGENQVQGPVPPSRQKYSTTCIPPTQRSIKPQKHIQRNRNTEMIFLLPAVSVFSLRMAYTLKRRGHQEKSRWMQKQIYRLIFPSGNSAAAIPMRIEAESVAPKVIYA